jgi:hypothetical protein
MFINSSNLGLTASLISLISMLLYPVLFIIIIKTKGLFRWTNVNDMLAFENKGKNFTKYLSMWLMIVYACSYLMIALSLKEVSRFKLAAEASVLFALAFCISVSVAYFVQLSAARLQMKEGRINGIEQLSQAYPISLVNAINMLGWTLFFPLSTLALALVFDASPAGVLCRIFCLLNSAFMFISMAAYITNKTAILMITMYPALGLSTIGLGFSLLSYFRLLGV